MRQRRCGWSIRMASRWVSLGRSRGRCLGLSGVSVAVPSGSGEGWVVSGKRLVIQWGGGQWWQSLPGAMSDSALLCSQSAQIPGAQLARGEGAREARP